MSWKAFIDVGSGIASILSAILAAVSIVVAVKAKNKAAGVENMIRQQQQFIFYIGGPTPTAQSMSAAPAPPSGHDQDSASKDAS